MLCKLELFEDTVQGLEKPLCRFIFFPDENKEQTYKDLERRVVQVMDQQPKDSDYCFQMSAVCRAGEVKTDSPVICDRNDILGCIREQFDDLMIKFKGEQ